MTHELRTKQVALLPFAAPWLIASYGVFYTRKRPLTRVGQLFMTQLRQVEVLVQTREQRALARLEGQRRTRGASGRRGRRTAGADAGMQTKALPEPVPPARRRPRKSL